MASRCRRGTERLTERFADLARRYPAVRNEVGEALENPAELRRLIERNPIAAWTSGKGTGGVSYFAYDGRTFATTEAIQVGPDLRETVQDLVGELAEWRLHAYFRRPHAARSADQIICNVSHVGPRPMLFLPDRKKFDGIPEGWQVVLVDKKEHQAKFVKVAVNVVARRGAEENVLPEILRRWFGDGAGRPGRTERVVFQRQGEGYVMMPWREKPPAGLVLWQRYQRDEVPRALGFEFKGMEAQSGIVERPGTIVLFVTLDKAEKPEKHRYQDRFISAGEFEWQSQNRTTQRSKLATNLRLHGERGIDIHLLVRRRAKLAGRTQPFIYCGALEFVRWDGERPITIWWKLSRPLPDPLRKEFGADGPLRIYPTE